MIKHITSVAALLTLTFSLAGTAAADEFGSGANTFEIEFVTIGDPVNPDDSTGDPKPAGSVGYTFQMGKFEISEDMIDKANAEGGLGITQDTRGPNKPATSVSWNEAARFVNWLNTSSGFAPAYKFEFQPGEAGYDSNANIQLWDPGDAGYYPDNLFRNSRAKYWLPSYDEWYKAAFYDPNANGGLGGYWFFPTGSDSRPTGVASGTAADTVVYTDFFLMDHPVGPADIDQAGGLSPYGTMGQGGNVWEWEESEFDLVNDSSSSARAIRGGSWNLRASTLGTSARVVVFNPTFDDGVVGFRVASLVLLGDANGDGVFNNLDIGAFGLALFNPVAYAAAFPEVDPDIVLDMNCDGAFNNLDISGFGSVLGL